MSFKAGEAMLRHSLTRPDFIGLLRLNAFCNYKTKEF